VRLSTEKKDLATLAAEEVRRHNRAMENIVLSTVQIEKSKKEIEITAIAQSAQLDNDKKSLESRIQKWNTYVDLRDKGMPNEKFVKFFPDLQEFIVFIEPFQQEINNE
jgi:aspartyl-tRNA synthetase